jgi:hypothetical protein
VRIGILSSHRVRCGVSEYSNRYADALAKIGHDPVILAMRAGAAQFDLPADAIHDVHDVGLCGHYNPVEAGGNVTWEPVLNLDALCGLGLDALHIQYQCSIIREEQVLAAVTICGVPAAVTFHDNAILGSFPWQAFNLRYSHREGVGIGNPTVIPFPIEDRAPLIRSFGLGRSQGAVIAPICERNGWRFEDIGPSQEWLSHEDLIGWLRGADAIVLWYPPEPRAGSSQALRDAMAARRFVVTNDTEWFADAPKYLEEGYLKVGTPGMLEEALWQRFRRPFVEQNSWTAVAARIVADMAALTAHAPACGA